MLAAQALELSEKHQLPQVTEYARCYLGRTRAELGRPSEGVALIRPGIAGLAAIGTRDDSNSLILAHAQALSGAIGNALETIEQVLQPNRPETNLMLPDAFRLRPPAASRIRGAAPISPC
jgi:hypothetical protein